MRSWVRISKWIYHALQRAYPAEFREIYGDDMSRAFVEGCEESGQRGLVKLARFFLTVLSDWSLTATLEHLDRLRQDLRYSIAALARSKMFALAAILCLSLGIGVSSTLFTTAGTLLSRPLPVTDPDRVVMFRASDGRDVSYPEYLRYRDSNQTFTGLSGWFPSPVSFGQGEKSEIVVAEIVTGNYFDVLGVHAALGRTFLPEEDQRPDTHPVVVLSDVFWKQRFGSDPQVIGRTVMLNGRPFVVVGVMPPSFTGSTYLLKVQLWSPIAMSGTLNWGGGPLDQLQVMVLGRLKPTMPMEKAAADVNRLHTVIAGEQRERRQILSTLSLFRPNGVLVTSLRRRIENVTIVLMVVVGMILVIACSNVGSLLLARAVARQQEIAVRMAVGASRPRLIRQLLTESFVLSSGGALGGLLMTAWLTRVLSTYHVPVPGPYAPFAEFNVDWRSVVFASVLALLTGLVFGMAPAWRASRVDLAPALKIGAPASGTSYQRARLRNALIVTQVALSFVLLVASGLFVRSMLFARRTDPGFEVRNIVLASVNVGMQGYTLPRGLEFYRQIKERLLALPGVRTVSAGRPLPLSGSDGRAALIVEGSGSEQPVTVAASGADLDYFDALRIPILRGRAFAATDTHNAPPVVVISESMERKLFPGADAVGRRLRTIGRQPQNLEIIGIARDVDFGALGEDPQPRVYDTLQQTYSPSQSLIIATSSDPEVIRDLVSREVHALDPNLPVEVKTMQEYLAYSLWPARIGAIVLGSTGVMAVLLACVGIYGVMAYSVGQRTREFGTRIAIGARKMDIIRLVVADGMRLALFGLGLGMVAAIAVLPATSSLLYGTKPMDPLTFLTVPVLLLAVTFLANYIPARRATTVDPVIALRSE
jgi:predicted permease